MMKIFEWLWLGVSIIALIMAITKFINGQAYGNYIYITLFTAGVALFMYWFKKRNRLYMEKRQKDLQDRNKE